MRDSVFIGSGNGRLTRGNKILRAARAKAFLRERNEETVKNRKAGKKKAVGKKKAGKKKAGKKAGKKARGSVRANSRR